MLRFVTAQQIYDVSKIYVFYTDLFILIAGLISNILMIIILNKLRNFRGNQCAFYLMWESITNVGLLLISFPPQIISNKLGYDLTYTSLAWCKLKTAFSLVFGVCSVYTICFSAIDQYLATNHRYSFRQMSTMKLAHRLTIINICFCILHNLIFLIFTEIQSTFGCQIYNPILKQYFSFFYYPILSTGLPLIITSIFSLLAYHNVRHLVRRQVKYFLVKHCWRFLKSLCHRNQVAPVIHPQTISSVNS